MQATVDGLILASPRMNDDDIRMLAATKPVVVINRDVEGVSCVIPDVNGGISAAVRSLAEQGHRKIAFVAGPPQSWMSVRRWEGVQAASDWSRIEAIRLETAKPTVDGGRRVAREVLASGATAVMTYNDLLAIGLMQELQAAGVVVPDQISIVGFDDIFGADFTTPPLTTIRSPLATCGTTAATLLLNKLDREEEGPSLVHVDTELILRGSSGRLLPSSITTH
jgi:LacI family transcriptional regulator